MGDKKPEMLVWAEPIKRGDLRLVRGDVEEALSWFKEQMVRKNFTPE